MHLVGKPQSLNCYLSYTYELHGKGRITVVVWYMTTMGRIKDQDVALLRSLVL